MSSDPLHSQPEQIPAASASGQGCAQGIGRTLTGVVIIAVTIVVQVVQWSLEQTIFEGSLGIPDMRWMVSLGYALGLTVLLGVLTLLAPSLRGKTVFRTWLAASLFALLQAPAHALELTNADLIAGLQLAGELVFILAAFLLLRRRLPRGAYGLAIAAAVGILLMLPWVAWGALGSPLDLALNLLIGLLFGVAASLLLSGILLHEAPNNVGADGLVLLVALAIMATGLGNNGQQWMLAAVLIPLSWAAVALSSQPGKLTRLCCWISAAVLLGLAAAAPLVWVDADELALVISSGAGELAQVALNMVLDTAVMGMLASFLLGLISRIREGGIPSARGLAILPVVVLAAVGAVYLLSGQPGFYGEQLFVILADQADLEPAAQISNFEDRRAYVYETLVEHADSTQADLRTALQQRNRRFQPYYLVNGLAVNGGPLLRAWLEARPEVDRVLSNPILRPLPATPLSASGGAVQPDSPEWNLTLIGADRVWSELDVDGAGVIIGQSDSGVQGDHPELAASYRGAGGQNDYNWYDPWNGSLAPVDIGGHGTHTLGTIVGENVGVAPGAQWIGCVNLARNLGNPAYYLDCMQFMLAPFPQGGDALHEGDPARGAMVLNNSWGCPEVEGCDPTSLEPAVRSLRAAGVFVVVSAGNSGLGGCGTVSDPLAIYDEVYSVAAVDSGGTRADFSSMGPVTVDGSNRMKPDIAAPGVNVLSSYPNNTYEYNSGTSMAGPHVVGVVALMWSANPALIGDIERTTQILNETARPYRGPLPACASGQGTPNVAAGYGVVDAYAAVERALELR